ncbi:MAG: DUF3325 domain-containing protein [Candidatus Accumulibacter sp.]|jgi:hypothetical protein|nr:DUF3325 domain-containing protein [Accumulibacter sp.]
METVFSNTLFFALTVGGLCFLSLGIERHAKQAFGKAPPREPRRARSALGAAMLALSLASSIQTSGVSIGIAVFFGTVAVVSIGVALMLAFRPRLLRFVGAVAAAVAPLAFLAGFFS